MKPEITIYYQESKKVSEPSTAYFNISGRDLVGLNGCEIIHTGDALEQRIGKLAQDNPGLLVRNRIPFVDIPQASFLEVNYGTSVNTYRPLTPQEIPESVKTRLEDSN